MVDMQCVKLTLGQEKKKKGRRRKKKTQDKNIHRAAIITAECIKLLAELHLQFFVSSLRQKCF